MADPNRPTLPPLKRFQRLEMDGDPPPARPARPPKARAPAPAAPRVAAPAAEPADIVEARRLAADLTTNARESLAQTGPVARRTARAAELRAARETWPAPSAPGTPRPAAPPEPWVELRAERRADIRTEPARGRANPNAFVAGSRGGAPARTFRFEVGQLPTMIVDPAPRAREPLDLPGVTPGVVVMEVDLGRPRERARDADDAPGVWAAPPSRAQRGGVAAAIELTPFAARQVKLMAWEAGMPGSGLRILTSFTPGLGLPECDFAFDDDVQDDDVVFYQHGVRLIVDRASLGHLRGRRITWHDVPGSEGFGIR